MGSTFEDLTETLRTRGSAGVADQLCQTLHERKAYHDLFYALLMRKRLELGLPAVQVGSSEDIPRDLQQPYEDAIREAARRIGQLHLDDGDIPGAWPYFRMIHEPDRVVEAMDKADPEDGDQVQQVVDIALREGVHPRRGFELVLKRFGICSAITMFGQDFPFAQDIREHCVKRLVQALYEELRDRLTADIVRREGTTPTETSVRELLNGRDWLMDDEFYHIDVSHLGAVVQYCYQLSPCPELLQAIELCEYGMKLSPRFQYPGDPPFEDQYRDYHVYFRTIAGLDVEGGIAHFQAKAGNANPEETGTLPAEVLVNLLVRLERYPEAVEAYQRYLGTADQRRTNCPSLAELCHKAGDYQPLIEVSRQRGDLVNYTAGLLQSTCTK
jgi:hypothetical protein